VNEDCLKLTTYFGERDRMDQSLAADALLDLYAKAKIETSVLLRGATGFGLKHHLRTDRLLTLSEDLPLISVAVDTRFRIEAVLDRVTKLQHRGLLTLERARMVTDGVGEVSLPEELNEATKLTVYLGRREQVEGRPGYMAVCDLLYRRGVAGVTALLGVDGTARGERKRARFIARNGDVPMMVLALARAGELPPCWQSSPNCSTVRCSRSSAYGSASETVS
jgi:PII-like signaling protein